MPKTTALTDFTRELRFLDGRRSEMTDVLRAWCAINTGSGNLGGLAQMRDVLAEAFSVALGVEAEIVSSKPHPVVSRDGDVADRPVGDCLRFVKRPQAPVRVLLAGHMDTVFPADHPFQNDRMIDADTMNAPGAADMKGGILVMLRALEAVERSSVADRIGFEVILNADEEIGSLGSDAILREAASRAHFACCYEPALADGTLAGARKGTGNFSAVFSGRSAHAGREHHLGRNAVVAGAGFACAVSALSGAREGLTVNVARIDGGGPNNVVPDKAVVRFNVRTQSPDDADWVRARLDELVDADRLPEGVSALLHGGFTRPPKPMSPELLAFFQSLRAIGAELGVAIDWKATGGVCDGNNIAAAGVPVIDTLGVRGGDIHSEDEFVRLDSLEERAKLSALLLMRIAAGDIAVPGAASDHTIVRGENCVTDARAFPVIRPVRGDDFDQVLALAEQSGGGMTNLPADPATLRSRIDYAVDCFANGADAPDGAVYMMVLEVDGLVLGTCAVFASVGLNAGFVNYKVIEEFQLSQELNKRTRRRVLVPSHDFTGASEVGSLFLSRDARGGGFGKLLARARYLFMAQSEESFNDRVCAELRGWRAPDGRLPFWEALGRRFFDMDFEEADLHNAAYGNQFIQDLLPRHPVYECFLGEEASACIGKPHDNARPAYEMLMAEGFEFDNYIDIFDGGPLVNCKLSRIRTVRDSAEVTVAKISDTDESLEGGADYLVARGAVDSFRCVRAAALETTGFVTLAAAGAAQLEVGVGDRVRVAPW